MKIAVTGASGFVGRYVISELVRNGLNAVAITRDVCRLPDMPAGIRVVQLDLALSGEESYAVMGCPDILIHLAWDGLPNYKSLHHFETELPKQYKFIKSLVEAGLPSLIVTGTCFEYGMQSGGLSEEMPARPGNPYGYAKHALHQQLLYLKAQKSFDLTWARLFYMYGEGQSGSSLYQSFKAALSRGDREFKMSGGEQLRDFLPVSEVAELIVRLATQSRDVGTVNLCAGKPVSVRTLVEGWLADNKSTMKLDLGCFPYPDYEPMAFWGNRKKLDSILQK